MDQKILFHVKQAFFLCLALGIPSAYGEENRQAQPVAAPITLYTQFQQDAPPAVVNALHYELDTIMAPIGMRFEWRSLATPRVAEISVELAVIKFKGHCDAANLLPLRSSPGALGWTHVSDGTILPFSDIDCDRIRDFVQRDLLTVDPKDREDTFGRAMARVLAHELYHIFANTAKHGSCGIGKAAYTVQELLSDDFQFENRESQALRDSKTRAILETAASTM